MTFQEWWIVSSNIFIPYEMKGISIYAIKEIAEIAWNASLQESRENKKTLLASELLLYSQQENITFEDGSPVSMYEQYQEESHDM